MTEPIKKKYVTDDKGKKTAVILDLKIYQQLIDEIDELNCSLGYDQAKKEVAKDLETGNVKTIEELIAKRHIEKRKYKTRT